VLDFNANSVLTIRHPNGCGESCRHNRRSLSSRYCVEAFEHRGRFRPFPEIVVADRKWVRAPA